MSGRRNRVAALRDAARRSLIAPGLVLGYSVLTLGSRNRTAMVILSTALIAIGVLTWFIARPLAKSWWRRPASMAVTFVQMTGLAVLSYLDGGVLSPIGPMVLLSLPFVAMTVPTRLFAILFVMAFAEYWAVAWFGERTTVAYVIAYTVCFGAVCVLCARHAQALASLGHRLSEVSRVDPLTGCLNRRGFDERLRQELSKAKRSGKPVTVVVVDLDSFKEVNDVHGHQTGDDLLAWIGRTLRETARANDAVGRLGGDEFGVVLANAGPEAAAVAVGRLRSALEPFAPASMGTASYPDEATETEPLRQLADERLYADKAERGASPSSPQPPPLGATIYQELTVPSDERRRTSIAHTAWNSIVYVSMGVVYATLLPGEQTPRAAVLAIMLAGLAAALAVVIAARRIARSPKASLIMAVYAVSAFANGIVGAAIDGGAASPIAVSLLGPASIVALTTPRRFAFPVLGFVGASYATIGFVVGAPSRWYVIAHLIGFFAVALVCASEGRKAANARRQLTTLARVDGLTNCLNRRGFEERFDAELAGARREGQTLSVLLFDLDGFKQLNDTQGHAAGDELLCWVGETLSTSLRAHDVVGRLGGDEFVVLLSGCAAADADMVADRLCAALAKRTRVSVGAATLDDHGDAFDDLYRHADQLLYIEKAARKAESGTGREAASPPSAAGF